MSINDIGKEGEKMAREILKNRFHVDAIFQADWLINKNGVWYVVEVKHKQMFTPPPFYGQGLNTYQADMRIRFWQETGIRCLFLVIDAETGSVYWQWLDKLQETKYHETRNGIRIYDIDEFVKLRDKVPDKFLKSA